MEVLPHEKEIVEYEKTIEQFKEQNDKNPLMTQEELHKLEEKLDVLKEKIYSTLTPWERVQICRHPNRPRALDYAEHLTEEFVELAGDRLFSDDHAVVGGLAQIGAHKCMLIGQEKGGDTESRLYRNFGMLHPEGFRKALRLARFAEKFQLPVVLLLDTPGAYCGLTAEERGQGWAIALNLREFFRIATPLIALVIGEGCSGGALGMGIGDSVAMLEHAYYSVISPESCASILWKDTSQKAKASEILKMHAEDLVGWGVIDTVIKEPLGGAHHDPAAMYQNVKKFLNEKLSELKTIPLDTLLERRYQKFRTMGCFTVETASSHSPS